MARSSIESEYHALSHIACEMLWLWTLLQDIGIPFTTAPLLWCDNISFAALAHNPIFHGRIKHIEIDAHFIRDQVLSNQLAIRHIRSQDQLVDTLTKSLSSQIFQTLRDKLGL